MGMSWHVHCRLTKATSCGNQVKKHVMDAHVRFLTVTF
jgi:hypothetical protein